MPESTAPKNSLSAKSDSAPQPTNFERRDTDSGVAKIDNQPEAVSSQLGSPAAPVRRKEIDWVFACTASAILWAAIIALAIWLL